MNNSGRLLTVLILLSALISACQTASSPLPDNEAGSPGVVSYATPTIKFVSPKLTPSVTLPVVTPTSLASPTLPTPTPASQIHPVSPGDGTPAGEVRNLWVDSDGHLWVASESGIFVNDDDEWNMRYKGSVERILGADSDGRIWAILDGETAIAAYDISGNWKVYGPEQGWTVPPAVEYLSPGYGDGIVTDSQHQVWVATGRDDLRRFDPISETWEVYNATEIGFEPPAEDGYQGHFLTDVELSGNQKVWVGNCVGMGESLLGQGIRWYDGESWFDAPFTFGECVQDIEIDDADRMWVGGFDALLQYDPASGSWSRIPLPPWERRQLVMDITLDGKGNPWVEILRFGGASPLGEVVRYHLQDGVWVMDYEGWFSSLALGEDGEAWLCSEGDVYRLENGQAEVIDTLSGKQCQIVVDGTGRVWVNNDSTLWWFDPLLLK